MSSCFFFFFFNDTATTEIYTLSLHDALPICTYAIQIPAARISGQTVTLRVRTIGHKPGLRQITLRAGEQTEDLDRKSTRLNSSHLVISYAVFCLKKKKSQSIYITIATSYR